MADERLYVKIVMPKQGVERPKQGGSGEIKNFHTVTPALRTRLTTGLDSAEQLLVNLPSSRPVVPLKATVVAKALAKSHWHDALFDQKSCPVIGAGKPGELFLKGSREGIQTLKRRILHGQNKQMVKEISALKELRPLLPEDRLNGVSSDKLFSVAPENNGRRALKVKLFDYSDPKIQDSEIAAFETRLQSNALSFIRHPQYKGQDVYTVMCKTEKDVGFLSNQLSVRSVGLIPCFAH